LIVLPLGPVMKIKLPHKEFVLVFSFISFG